MILPGKQILDGNFQRWLSDYHQTSWRFSTTASTELNLAPFWVLRVHGEGFFFFFSQEKSYRTDKQRGRYLQNLAEVETIRWVLYMSGADKTRSSCSHQIEHQCWDQ